MVEVSPFIVLQCLRKLCKKCVFVLVESDFSFFKAVQFQLHKSKCDALCKFIYFKNDCVIYPQLQTGSQPQISKLKPDERNFTFTIRS